MSRTIEFTGITNKRSKNKEGKAMLVTIPMMFRLKLEASQKKEMEKNCSNNPPTMVANIKVMIGTCQVTFAILRLITLAPMKLTIGMIGGTAEMNEKIIPANKAQ